MKVLAITHGFGFGGAEISILEFLELLRGEVQLKVLMCDGAHEIFSTMIEELGIYVYRVPCHRIAGYPVMDVEGVRKLVEWADLVWITDAEYLVAPIVKRLKNIPLTAHLHSYALICPWWGALYRFREPCLEKCSAWRITRCRQDKNLEYSRIGLISWSRARLYWSLLFVKGPVDYVMWRRSRTDVFESIDGYIAVSNASWRIHTSHIPNLNDKLSTIIYYPITMPLKHVKLSLDEPYSNYIVYASGPGPIKGPHILLEAWSEVSREHRDLKLYMVWCKGSWVEKVAERRGLKNIVFTEKLSLENLYHLMYKARAVVMPSVWVEPFGRIPVEANKLGVPAIISSSTGVAEVMVDSVTGYIFKSGDPGELSEKIIKLINESFDRATLIKYSSEKLNAQRQVSELIKFFERVSHNA
jgi:glycosyltransferase involved in cell wall biosynthesis